MSVVKETYNRLRITIPAFAQGDIKIEQTEERLSGKEEVEDSPESESDDHSGGCDCDDCRESESEEESSSDDEEYNDTIAAMKRRIDALERGRGKERQEK